MLKIRLVRIGTKMRPFYRVVVMDERSKRNGAYIELLGTYNPLTEPKEIKLKQDRIDHWVKMGAQKSIGFLRIIGKAPQRPPRKPKKEKKAPAETAAPAAPAEEKPAEEAPTEQPVQAEEATQEIAQTEQPSNQAAETPTAESADNTEVAETPKEETKDEGSA